MAAGAGVDHVDGNRPEASTAEVRKPHSFIEQARRAQIVRAAVATIAEIGYARATLAVIAARAEVSPSLIPYHFGSKDRLVAQVVRDVEAEMEAAIQDEVGEPASYRAALRGVIESQVRYFAAHRAEVVALGEIRHHQRGATPGGREVAEGRAAGIAGLESLLAEGQREGELDDFDPRVVAVTIMAALEAVPTELFANPDVDPVDHGSQLAALFDRAVRR